MISLRVFLMILTTLLLQQVGKQLSWENSVDATLLVFGYCMIFAVVGKFLGVLAIIHEDQRREQPRLILDRFADYRRSLEMAWIAMLPLALLGTGWGSLLQDYWNSGWPHSIILAMWLAPSLVFWLSLDLCTAQLEHHLVHSDLAKRRLRKAAKIESVERHDSGRALDVTSLWRMQVRLGPTGGAIMCIAPMFAVVSTLDTMRAVDPQVSSALQAAVAGSMLLLVVAIIGPLWMSSWIGAKLEAEGPLRTRFQDLCKQLGIRAPGMRRIESERAWHGAAIVGWSRWSRQLWLSESVIQHLSVEELDMVMLHELAHLLKHHTMWRMVPIGLSAIVAMAVVGLGRIFSESTLFLGTTFEVNVSTLCDTVAVITAVAGMIAGLSWAAKKCELDADRTACDLAASGCGWSFGERSTSARILASALRKLCPDQNEAAQESWLHPSVIDRCEALRTLSNS